MPDGGSIACKRLRTIELFSAFIQRPIKLFVRAIDFSDSQRRKQVRRVVGYTRVLLLLLLHSLIREFQPLL